MTLPVFIRNEALSMLDEDEELLKVLLQTFVETEFSIQKLNDLIESGNLSEAASYVHRVKGAGRQLAMKKLANSGQNLEDVLRGKTSGDIKSLSIIFDEDYQEGLKAAQDELKIQ